MIAGIVLAGGESKRMGRPKALLPIEGETFLGRTSRTLREGGCSEVVVVKNPAEPALQAESGCADRTVPGGGPGTEQIDSLRAGLRVLSAGTVEAAVVHPVDHPLVEPATVAALIRAFRDRRPPIALPVHAGRHGHPVLFSAAVFEELLEGDVPEGARSIVHAHAGELAEVPVDDPGVLVDVDTPGEYEHHVGTDHDG